MNNQQVFLALLRAGLWGDVKVNGFSQNDFDSAELKAVPKGQADGLKVIDLPVTIDYDEVLRLSGEQSVVGLVAAGLETLPTGILPLTEKLKLVGMCQLIEQRNVAMNRFITELVRKMQEAGINVVLVKGQGVAQCYEKPLWRAAGDIDFMLDEENYRKAKSLLTPLATHVETEDKPRMHLGMTFEPWTVELHGTMHTGVSRRINRVIDEVQREVCTQGSVRSWNNGGVEVMLPNPGNDALLIFTHFINHFYGSGIGLRQMCDWCRLLWTYRGQMDVELLHARLQAMGLLSEWKAFAAFAVELLGMPEEVMPLYEKSICYKRKATRLCNLILETGDLGNKKDESYRLKHSRTVSNIITFFRRFGEFARIATIFPADAPKYFVTYAMDRIKANNKR